MRRFHPDLPGRKEALERKAKEINEAYQVLKDESTRMEYDFKRNYYREKNRLQHRRKGLLTSLLGILFIIGLISLLKFFPQIKSPLTRARGDTGTQGPKGTATLKQEERETSRQADAVTQGTRDIKRRKPSKPEKRGRGDTGTQGLKDAATLRQQEPKTSRQAEMDTLGREDRGAESPKDATILRQEEPRVPRQADAMVSGRDDTTTPGLKDAVALRQAETDTLGREERGIERPKGTTILRQEEPRVPRQTEVMTLGRDDTPPPELKDTAPPRQGDLKTPGQAAASHLDQIAGEEEVRHFFAHYLDRYVRKDIDGFLSCFSSKAIQNRKEKLQGIRKIYATFFNQSRDLRYELQDWRVDFYRNGVAVTARYQLDQVLKKGGRKSWKGDIRWTLIKEEGALKILFLDYQQQK
jgi:hypothetical protein